MNEETQNKQPEKTGLDEKRKTALLRYVAILFAVAFVLVLFSMLAQMRNSKLTISQLNQTSTSSAQKVQQLQETNQQLETENSELLAQIEALEQELTETKTDAEAAMEEAEAAWEAEKAALLQEQESLEGNRTMIALAYENLLTAMKNITPGSQEGNVTVSKALENLEELQAYLGQNGLEVYETLLEEGE